MQMLLLLLFLLKGNLYLSINFISSEQPSYLAEQTAVGGGSFPPSSSVLPEDQPGPSTSAKTSSTRHPASTGLASAAGA